MSHGQIWHGEVGGGGSGRWKEVESLEVQVMETSLRVRARLAHLITLMTRVRREFLCRHIFCKEK